MQENGGSIVGSLVHGLKNPNLCTCTGLTRGALQGFDTHDFFPREYLLSNIITSDDQDIFFENGHIR
jgi:hypothetical protein